MKLLLTVTLFLCSLLGASQILSESYQPEKIRSISPSDKDFSDLEFLKKEWADKRFILLGEQSHGDGATFEARVRLIKFLHQEMGFDLVVFESGMYDNYKAWESFSKNGDINEPFKKSILSIWSETAENEMLIDYSRSTINGPNPLQIGGFDFIRNDYFKATFIEDLKQVLPDDVLKNKGMSMLEDVILSGVDPLWDGTMDTTIFYSTSNSVLTAIEQKTKANPTEEHRMLLQSFKTWIFGIRYELDELQGKKIAVQNPRDAKMAENFVFLSELHPERKIIAIGASMHFSNEVLNVKNTPVTAEYVLKIARSKEEEEFDLEKEIEGAIPMGQLLKNRFGEKLFSLAFSSFEGTYGIVGTEPYKLESAPENSLEKELAEQSLENGYVSFNEGNLNTEWFYLSALGNIPVYGKWATIFDGLFFIKDSKPPLPIVYESVGKIGENTDTPQIFGRILDAESGQAIPFVNIALKGTSQGTSSNEKGYFVFNRFSDQPTLVFSSIGYENDTVMVSNTGEDLLVDLNPKSYLLDEVVVTNKPLSAEDIIKLAKKNREENYYHKPMNQEFFFSSTHFANDSMTFNEESAVILYGDQGYKSTNNPAGHFYGEILQYRNTTGNPSKDKWRGVGSMWLVLTHDVIFDKANVLNRTNAYDLKIEGIKQFEDQFVYEISFECNNPSAVTVGFGFPAPEAATGTIYINTSDYAVVKYEVCVPRKESTSKKHKSTIYPWGHRLIQTYKNYRGKYFLNTSISYNYYHYSYSDGHPDSDYSYISILNSTQIETENVKVIKRPVQSIAVDKKIAEDQTFWNTFNYLISNKEIPVFGCE